MNNHPHDSTDTSDREIVTTRIFDAPRELVWKAWTEPKHLAQWWGPDGFTNTIHEMDVKPGGTWRFVMHGPDGTDYKNHSIFAEVVEPDRLSYDHVSGPKFHAKVTFENVDGKTRLTLRMIFGRAAERNKIVHDFGAIEGARQTFQHLADFLTKI